MLTLLIKKAFIFYTIEDMLSMSDEQPNKRLCHALKTIPTIVWKAVGTDSPGSASTRYAMMGIFPMKIRKHIGSQFMSIIY
ncbi:MAG: hypothetical protein AO395_02325 [Candidatus Fermentibacter daniensis]|nr:MAG: hypothetical protein AO395_02325 [Candidatus Fermentibacter daniensis]